MHQGQAGNALAYGKDKWIPLSQSQVQATDVTYAAFTTIVLPGAAIDNTVCIHPNAERSASK